MDRGGMVAEGIQTGGQIGGAALDIHLIRRAVVRQKCHRITGEELQLGVGGAAAEGGYGQAAADGVLLPLQQLAEVGDGVLVGLHRTDHAEIRKGFVHDHDQIGCPGAFLTGVFVCERSQLVCAVPLGLLDERVGRAAQEIEDLTVLTAGLPEGQSGADALDAGIGDDAEDEHARQREQAAEVPACMQLPAALHQAYAQAEQHRRGSRTQHGKLDRGRVALRYVGCRADGGNIAQHNRCAAEQHNIMVDHAVQQGDRHADAQADPHAAEQQQQDGVNRHIADPALKEGLLERDHAALDHVFDQNQADSRRGQKQQQIVQHQHGRGGLGPRAQQQWHEGARQQPVVDHRLIVQRALAQQGIEQHRECNGQQNVTGDFVWISLIIFGFFTFEGQKRVSFRATGKSRCGMPQRL